MRAHARGILYLSLILVASLVLAACAARDRSREAEAQATEEASEIGSFEPVAALFEANCALSACHSAARGAGQLVLAPDVARDSLVDVPSSQQDGATLVAPGDPEGSYLLAKLRGDDGIRGARMPIGRSPLSDEDIAMIAEWIAGEGATE